MNIAAFLFKKQPQTAHSSRSGVTRSVMSQAKLIPSNEAAHFNQTSCSDNFGIEVEELSLEEFHRRLHVEDQQAKASGRSQAL